MKRRRDRRKGRCSSKRRKVDKRKYMYIQCTAIESSANVILPCQGFKNDITNLQTAAAGTYNLKTHFLWFLKCQSPPPPPPKI